MKRVQCLLSVEDKLKIGTLLKEKVYKYINFSMTRTGVSQETKVML